MALGRRFVVILMRRLLRFVTSQQLVVPGLFLIFFTTWHLTTGGGIYKDNLPDISKVAVPYVFTAWIVWVFLLISAAKELDGEVNGNNQQTVLRLVDYSGRDIPQRAPVLIVWSTATVLMVIGGLFPAAAVYEAFLSVEKLPPLQIVLPHAAYSQVIQEHPVFRASTGIKRGYLIVDGVVPDFSHLLEKRNISLDIELKNHTPLLVRDVVTFGMIAFGRKEQEQEVQKDFREELKVKNGERDINRGTSIGPNEKPIIVHLEGPALLQGDVDAVFEGSKRMYILVWARWHDENGRTDHLQECWWASRLDKSKPNEMLLNTCEVSQ